MKSNLIIIALMMCGCSSSHINNKWVGAINEYGIVAIYPPREDIYIGSIYLQVANEACRKGYQKPGCEFSSIKIARLDDSLTRELLEDSYSNSPEFRLTDSECQKKIGEINSANKTSSPTQASSTFGCYYEGKVTNIGNSFSFKRIGLPDYNIEKESSGGIGAIVPMTLLQRLAFSGKNVKNYSVSVPNSLYYSISMPLLIKRLNSSATRTSPSKYENIESVKFYGEDLKPKIINIPLSHGTIQNLTTAANHLCPKRDCQISLVIPTEVYYSSVFNVNLVTDSETHLATNNSLEDDEGKKTQFKPEITNNKIQPEKIISGSSDLGFGVASTYNYISKNTISLKSKFDALLAIGYRGLSYVIVPEDIPTSSPSPRPIIENPPPLKGKTVNLIPFIPSQEE
nr:MAG TPA: hypothetical protein [Caudoviricetes sp.]